MKVVLFCGGMGMRMREYSETVPKPMVPIGYRPILWHIMKYYAPYGHKDFVLCLGHKADVIKSYFRNCDECTSNDFVLSGGGKNLELLNSDVDDWRITFVDTGLAANIISPFLPSIDIVLHTRIGLVTGVSLRSSYYHSLKAACAHALFQPCHKPGASHHASGLIHWRSLRGFKCKRKLSCGWRTSAEVCLERVNRFRYFLGIAVVVTWNR